MCGVLGFSSKVLRTAALTAVVMLSSHAAASPAAAPRPPQCLSPEGFLIPPNAAKFSASREEGSGREPDTFQGRVSELSLAESQAAPLCVLWNAWARMPLRWFVYSPKALDALSLDPSSSVLHLWAGDGCAALYFLPSGASCSTLGWLHRRPCSCERSMPSCAMMVGFVVSRPVLHWSNLHCITPSFFKMD